jgi:dihydrofolate reductase
VAKLIYPALPSLDGYIEDDEGRFDWAMPDAEVHAFVNDLERPVGTHLYGRRMYETMAVWQTVGDESGLPAVEAEFAENTPRSYPRPSPAIMRTSSAVRRATPAASAEASRWSLGW